MRKHARCLLKVDGANHLKLIVIFPRREELESYLDVFVYVISTLANNCSISLVRQSNPVAFVSLSFGEVTTVTDESPFTYANVFKYAEYSFFIFHKYSMLMPSYSEPRMRFEILC